MFKKCATNWKSLENTVIENILGTVNDREENVSNKGNKSVFIQCYCFLKCQSLSYLNSEPQKKREMCVTVKYVLISLCQINFDKS